MAVGTNPDSLDPRFANDSLGSKIAELTCPGLTARDADGRLVPELAESWRWESPTMLRFTLREGLLFHDGSSVEAEDVVSTYRSILDPATGSVYAGALSELESVEAPGLREVLFRLKTPSAAILQDLVEPGVMKRGLPPTAEDRPVCAGAFRPVRFVRDDQVELAAFDGYFRGRPRVSRLVFRVVPDETIRVLEVAHGSADLLQNDFPRIFLPLLSSNSRLHLESRPGRLLKYLVFNLRKPPLNDARVRRALALSIDREAIVRFKLSGGAEPADSIFAAEDPYHQAAFDLPFDPGEAERLLDQAGLRRGADGIRCRLTWKTSLDETAVGVAKVIGQELSRVGVALSIQSEEFGIFLHDVQTGGFELYALTSSAIVDPDFLRWLLSSANIPPRGSLSNRGGYQSEELDRLLEAGRGETDPAKRRPFYDQAQRIVARDLPVVPLWHESVVAAYPAHRLADYRLSPVASYIGLRETAKR